MDPSRNIRVLRWLNFCVDFRPYAAIAIIYFAQVTHSYVLAASVFAVVQVSAAAFQLPTGVYADRVGRRRCMVLGSVSMLVAIVLYASAQNFAMLAAGAMLEGLSFAFYSGNQEALLYESVVATDRVGEYPHILGRVSSLNQIGLLLSTPLGGFFAVVSLPLAVWVSVLPQIGTVIVSLLLVNPPRSAPRGGKWKHIREAVTEFVREPRLRLLGGASAVNYGVGESVFQFQAAFYALLWPIWAVGLAKTAAFLGGAISFFFSGALVRRFGALPTLMIGRLYSRVVTITALVFPSHFSPALMAMTSLTYGSGVVSTSALLQDEFTDHQRATLGSIVSLAGSVAYAGFAVVMGALADRNGPAFALLVAQLCMLPVLLAYLRLRR